MIYYSNLLILNTAPIVENFDRLCKTPHLSIFRIGEQFSVYTYIGTGKKEGNGGNY
jgi:hypothetical protein